MIAVFRGITDGGFCPTAYGFVCLFDFLLFLFRIRTKQVTAAPNKTAAKMIHTLLFMVSYLVKSELIEVKMKIDLILQGFRTTLCLPRK